MSGSSQANRPGALTPTDALFLLGVNLLWGSTYAVARGVLETAPPILLACVRFLLAGVFLLLFGAHRYPARLLEAAEDRRGDGSALRSLLVVGVVGFGLSKVLNYEGLSRSTATDAALIINLEPVFTALFAWTWLRQRLGPVQWAGILVAFAGGAFLVFGSTGTGRGYELTAGTRVLGNALMVGSIAAEAVASVLGVRAMARYTGLQVTAWGTYLGAVVLLPVAAFQWSGAGYRLPWLTPGNLAALLYLALGATVLAYTLWYRVLSRVDAGRAAAFLYVQPFVGVTLGMLGLGERPGLEALAGGALVLTGVVLVSRPAPKPAAAEAQA